MSLTAIGIAAVAARARTVWLCAGVLAAGYACGVLLEHTPSQLARDGRLGGVIGALVGYPVAAVLLLALRRRFTRFVADAHPTLEAIRAGSPGQSPALEQALRSEPIALLPAPRPGRLTTSEREIVEGLASGLTAKQLAFERGISINTVRTHIRNGKRKTGARTLRELATMAAHPDWRDGAVDDG